MEKPRSYAVFEDEHEEDLLYFETNKSGHHIFATKSGIYRYWPEEYRVNDTSFITRPSYFDRLGPALTDRTDEIKCVVIDKRVTYVYVLGGPDFNVHGEVVASEDADEEEIRQAIMKSLIVRYEKK